MFLKTFIISFLLQQKNGYVHRLFLDTQPILKYRHDSFFSNNESGCDMTYNATKNKKNDSEILINITRFNYQMKLLNKLENPDVSQHDKLDAIERYNNDNSPSKYLPNIKAGGLFKDFLS
jgi:hypothetical protein